MSAQLNNATSQLSVTDLKNLPSSTLLETLPVGILIVEASSGKILAWNSRLQEIWRHTIPSHIAVTTPTKPEPSAGLYTFAYVEWAVSTVIHTNACVQETITITRGDSTPGTVHIEATSLRDGDGKVLAVVCSCVDQTAAKLTEQELQKITESFHAVVENAPDLIGRFDRDLRHLFISPGIERLTGFSPQHFIGKTNREAGIPEYLTNIWDETLRRVFETGEQLTQELEFNDPRNVPHTYQMRAGPEHAPDGSVQTVLTIIRDITEAKQVERRLHLQYSITRVLAEASHLQEGLTRVMQVMCEGLGWDLGALWLVDHDKNRLQYSTLWHLPGISADDFDAQSRQFYFSSGNGMLGKVWASGEPIWVSDVEKDSRFLRPGLIVNTGFHAVFGFPVYNLGTVIAVMEFMNHVEMQPDPDLMAMLMALGNQIGIFIERKRSEEVLAVRAQQQATVANLGQDALTSNDTQALVVKATRQLANVLKVDYAEVFELSSDGSIFTLRSSVGWPQGMNGTLTIPATANTHSGFTLATREPTIVEDFAHEPRFDGAPLVKEFGIVSGASTLIYGQGRPYGVLSVHTRQHRRFTHDDVHFMQSIANVLAAAIDRRKTDDALRLALDQTREMAVHNMHLLKVEAEARQEAERANDLKLKFLAMISHELRTPLTSIKGFTTTLLADDVSWDAETQRDFLNTINVESDKLTDMIEQLLDLSRLEAGTLRIQLGTYSLRDIVDTAMTQLQTVSSAHTLTIDVPETLPPVKADRQRIAQVLVNLVENAAKYSPHQGPIQVTARQDGPYIQVDVRDQGPGIPAGERKAVFEAFQRGASEIHKRIRGVGLGLAICKGLIEAHGGRIWVQDTPPPGAIISFTLPVVPTGN